MKLCATSLFLLISFSVFSQFGLSLKYANNDLNTWNSISGQYFTTDEDIHPQTLEIGLDYWFKLKNHRIEFFPELAIGAYKGVNYTDAMQNNLNFRLLQYGLNFNTHIYFLDLEGDCDCPTWSKQGTFFDKGLFLMISPGLMMMNHQAIINDITDTEIASLNNNKLAFKLGLGLGVDIGVTDLLTITPFVMYNYYPSVSSQLFDETLAVTCLNCDLPLQESGALNQIQIGLRIGFRPDYKGY